ncbi:hypothetical protein KCP73_24615 [Salmonella enterica subsp. enterica]|nr:hypothetical protein KCP73_24615 [Salmonella enterica subsp. enterica]
MHPQTEVRLCVILNTQLDMSRPKHHKAFDRLKPVYRAVSKDAAENGAGRAGNEIN